MKISMNKGWLELRTELEGYQTYAKTFDTKKRKKAYVKTFDTPKGKVSVVLDNFSVSPVSLHDYDLEKVTLKEFGDVYNEDIIGFEDYLIPRYETELKPHLSNEQIEEVKEFIFEHLYIFPKEKEEEHIYYIVSAEDSDNLEFGWIYEGSKEWETKNFIFLKSQLIGDYGLKAKKSEVKEISKEDYDRLFKHSVEGTDPSKTIREVLKNHGAKI